MLLYQVEASTFSLWAFFVSATPRNPHGWICSAQSWARCHRFATAAGCGLLIALSCVGCNGRAIKVDNPVFASAPPRRSLVNQSADAEEQRLAQLGGISAIQRVGFDAASSESLTGTSVVASVNSQPIFLDDVLGGLRMMIEQRPELNDDQRQHIMKEQLQKRLPNYLEQEIVLQALKAKIPEEKRALIRQSLEPMFQTVVANIKADKQLQTDEQMEALLAKEGMSISLLRETFNRAQMVNGYVATLATSVTTIDRQELVEYYQQHINEYTPAERVRVAEIVIRFDEHGGRPGAEKVMANVLTELQNQRDFGDVAAAFSDSLSAEKKGDLGWIERNALANRELEKLLFELPNGALTKVQTRPDRFELYKVINHVQAEAVAFQDVQKEIEQLLLKQKADEAKAKVVQDLKARSDVKTIFDKV